MVFPYDFGFLPQTLAPDGGPIGEARFSGCAVKARLIGVIEGEHSMARTKFETTALLRSPKSITCRKTSES